MFMLYKVALTFESVNEFVKCDHSNDSCWAVLSHGAVYYAVLYKIIEMILTFKSVDKILKSDHSKKGIKQCSRSCDL